MPTASNRIRCREARDGSLLYVVATGADALPPVRARDLDAAWQAARERAGAGQYGPVRHFRFAGADLTLSDTDACCWAAAVDAIAPLTRPHGLALCLRLLGLIDAIGRWAAPLCTFERDGATLHPLLLAAAADAPLTPQGSLAEKSLRARLAVLPPARDIHDSKTWDSKTCAEPSSVADRPAC